MENRYSSDGFEGQVLDHSSRDTLGEVAGPEVEAIVYLYGSCDKGQVYPQIGHTWPVRFRDRLDASERDLAAEELGVLCEMIIANAVELMTSRTERTTLSRAKSDLMRDWLPFVSPPARGAFEACARPLKKS